MGRSYKSRMFVSQMTATVTLIALTVLCLVPSATAAAQTSTISREQELVDRFAPIVMIKEQQVECSSDGEQFRPVAVDILFGTDDVRLMHHVDGKDIEVKRNIQASDLFGLDDSYFIDLPYDPRNPGCHYEKWGEARMAELGLQPSLYAAIRTEEGQDGIAIQYWYYWVYNLFNDVHESDWEGIQLTFDASSVDEILDKNLLPTSVAYAQHAGGESAEWGADKLAIQGTHVVTHPSSGSHADYYGSATWLGWGENGSGFGCDRADMPEEEIPVSVILLPDQVSEADSDFAWLTFQGNWGELEDPSLFSGPQGPAQHPRWNHPITWSQEIRKSSLPVPEHATIGPGISSVFCGAAEFGSKLVILFGLDGRDMSLLIVGFGCALLAFSLLVWRYSWAGFRLYFRHGWYFITIGVLTVPVAVVTRMLEGRLQGELVTHITARLPDSRFWRVTYEFLLRAMVGGVQELLMVAIIGPFVISGTWRLARQHGFAVEANVAIWEQSLNYLPRALGSRLLVGMLVRVLVLTLILAPVAIYKWVQWSFSAQAIVIDHSTVVDSVHVSANRMARGHWLRAAAMVVAFHALIGLPGPLIGTAALILGGISLEKSQWLSSLLYCVLFPIGLIAMTLFYLDRTVAPGMETPSITQGLNAGTEHPA